MARVSLIAQVVCTFLCLSTASAQYDPMQSRRRSSAPALNIQANIMTAPAGDSRRRQAFLAGPTMAPPRAPLENNWRMSDKSLWRPSAAFKVFDANENEVLSRAEIVDGSNMDGHMGFHNYLQDYDDDRDGYISIKEFDRDPIAAFKLLDMDGSGHLNSYELIENGNLDLSRATKFVQMMDQDGDGMISFDEYKKKHGSDKLDFVSLKAIKNEKSEAAQNAKNRKRGFARLDSNKDGMLSGQEVSALSAMNSEALRNYFKSYDLDHSGSIELAEFTQNNGPAFDLFDKNADGKVSLSEIEVVAGIDEDNALGFMQDIDEDEDEHLTKDEFDFTGLAAALPSKKEEAPQKELEGIKKVKAPQEDVAPASKAFKILDVDESSALTPFELMETSKMSKTQALEYFQKYDKNKNSQISAAEFERTGSAAFEAYDTNRNNVVEQKELQEVNNLRKTTAAAYIERFDLNGDGVIQRKEFKRTAMPPSDERTALAPGQKKRVPLVELAAEARRNLRREALHSIRHTGKQLYQQTLKDVIDDITK